MKILSFSLPYLRRIAKLIFVYVIISLSIIGIAIALPYFTGKLINCLTVGNSYAGLFLYSIIIGLLSVMRLILGYFNSITSTKITMDLGYFISCDVIRHVHDTSYLEMNEVNPIYLNQRISQDAGSIINFSIFLIINTITNILTIVVMFVLMLRISVKVTVFLCPFLVLYFLFYLFLKKPLSKHGIKNKEAQNLYFTKMSEQLQYMKFVKIHSLKEFFRKRLEQAYNAFKPVAIRFHKLIFFLQGLIAL